MTRTTLNIDDPILRDLKRLQQEEKKSLGRLVSDLLAWAIRTRATTGKDCPPPFSWKSRRMNARVNLADKEAVWSILDRDDSDRDDSDRDDSDRDDSDRDDEERSRS